MGRPGKEEAAIVSTGEFGAQSGSGEKDFFGVVWEVLKAFANG